MTVTTDPQEAEIIQLRQACTTCGASVGTTGLNVCARHVRDELGITYRQLDYAVRAGYLRPERKWKGRRWGSGSPRIWPEKELEVARLMGRLSAIGFPLETAHDLARAGSARTQVAPGIWLEFGPAYSGECAADDHGTCFPDEPSDCGCPCHEEEAQS